MKVRLLKVKELVDNVLCLRKLVADSMNLFYKDGHAICANWIIVNKIGIFNY